MIVKVCGITSPEDADAATGAGADAIGFNFYPASPRYITPERAAAIRTPAGVRRVGVFVNEPLERIDEIARIAGLDTAQLHGDETPAAYPGGVIVWKAARVAAGFDLSGFLDCPAEALVLDGPAAELYGGAGKTFDWCMAAVLNRRIILAGGLDASNVAVAIRAAHPWGVDACSRIESAPGKKDYKKMRQYIQAARAAQDV